MQTPRSSCTSCPATPHHTAKGEVSVATILRAHIHPANLKSDRCCWQASRHRMALGRSRWGEMRFLNAGWFGLGTGSISWTTCLRNLVWSGPSPAIVNPVSHSAQSRSQTGVSFFLMYGPLFEIFNLYYTVLCGLGGTVISGGMELLHLSGKVKYSHSKTCYISLAVELEIRTRRVSFKQ